MPVIIQMSVMKKREEKKIITDIDHPIGDLGHAKACCMAELFFLFLRGVWVVGVTMKPGLEVISGLLWKLAPLACGTIDEGGGRH